ncbi:synaptonemal complex central element protein 2 [Apteryx rowi]|uniref:synaptonemal complex central element protein 2 n=1 Tax=Apteryx rowi TaxID=308060 RepID=UPI000E1DDA14|nr:synaptonemal complex central element protein 2 [Apteryx rowi]
MIPRLQPALCLFSLRVAMSNQECENEDLEQEDARASSPFFAELARGELASETPSRKDPPAPLPCPGAEAAGTALDGKSSAYFAALDTDIGNLQQRTQRLIDKVNDNRREDHAVMSAFRESLLLQVSGLAEKLEERMFHTYDLHNRLIQEKLQELSEVMERIGHMETELRQVCRTVEAAYKDLCLQPEP